MAPAAADFSALGKLVFRGLDRVKVLQGLLTSDVAALRPGQGQRSCVLTPKGKLVADFFLYDRGEEFLVLCRPEYTEGMKAALGKILPLSKTALADESARRVTYLQGPGARELAGSEGLPYPLLHPEGWIALKPIETFPGMERLSPEALEVLRVEAGVAVPGVDFDADAYPLELGLEEAISFTKGCYMGQETVAHMKNLGHVNRRLVGLKLYARTVGGSPVMVGTDTIGKVTSVVDSPRLGAVLGLALVRAAAISTGTRVIAGGKDAAVVPLPVH